MRISPLLVFLSCFCLSCQTAIQYPDPLEGKVKGLVFTGPASGPLTDPMFSSMARVGSDFVALVPEATAYRQNLRVVHNFENQWFGERKEAITQGITLARANGLKVMLKPHLTIGWDMSAWDAPEVDFTDSLSRLSYAMNARQFISKQNSRIEGKGNWRGTLMTSETDWPAFEEGYTDFIMEYAQMADSLGVELFCIGTEMKRTALEKPDFWRRLIKKVRGVYDGPITYAANWDSYDKITFWDDLDYIGVDAYFPLSEDENPDLETLSNSWKERGQELENLAATYQKKIILTEWGYENENFVGAEPWIMGRYQNADQSTNEEAQAMAYRSMFHSIWEAPWMKGVFVWRWSPSGQKASAPNYSPRGKLAEKELETWFKLKRQPALSGKPL